MTDLELSSDNESLLNQDEPAEENPSVYTDTHSCAYFNLSREPWVPVVTENGQVTDVSLFDLFTDSHKIVDVAETEPLTRAALLRFLVTFTAYLLKYPPAKGVSKESWIERYGNNSGFTHEEVARTLSSVDNNLWLYHPTAPFMQHPAIPIGASVATADILSPTLPGDSTATWFHREADPNVRAGFTPAQASRGLIYRRYYALPGNLGGGDTGGTFSETTATTTHIFRRDSTSLFRTLLRNITPVMLAESPPGRPEGLAWLKPDAESGGDILYKNTLGVSYSLLGPVEEDGRIYELAVRRMQEKDLTRAIRSDARESDQFAVFLPEKATKKAAGEGPRSLRLDPLLNRVEHLGELFGDDTLDVGTDAIQGVVSSKHLWLSLYADEIDRETLTVFMAAKGGTATSAKYSAIGLAHMPVGWLEETKTWTAAKRTDLRTLVSSTVGRKNSVKTRFTYAIKNAVDLNQEGKPSPLAETLLPLWIGGVAQRVDDFTSGSVTAKEAKTSILGDTFDFFNTYTDPYATDPQHAAHIVNARNYLRKALAS